MKFPITKENYNLFLDYLYSFQDKKYQQFHKKLLADDSNVIGIRVYILRKIAKDIAYNQGITFLSILKHDTYEECVLHGLIIGYLNIDLETTIYLLNEFLPFNTNWAINDITVSTLKVFKKNLAIGYEYILSLLKKGDFEIRFALVLLLTYYVNEEYSDRVISCSLNVSNNSYYVVMANAWLISICYIKYKEKIEPLILNKKWDINTLKKAISKIKDSYRVNQIDKEKLNNFLKNLV